MSKITEELKDFYDKGGIQYALTKSGIIEEKKSDEKSPVPPVNTPRAPQSNSLPQVKVTEQNESGSSLFSEASLIQAKGVTEVQLTSRVPIEPVVDTSNILNELIQTEHIDIQQANEQKRIEESELLKDIKIAVEEKDETEEVIEIGDIFKKNEPLLKLLANERIIEDHSGDFLQIDDKFVAYLGYYGKNSDINISLLEALDNDSNIGEFVIHDVYIPIDSLSARKRMEKNQR